jgi:hypothetical protein
MVIKFRLVVVNVNSLFACFLFHLHIVTWSKRIDVYNTSMTEDLIVDEGRELAASKSEPNVALGSSV